MHVIGFRLLLRQRHKYNYVLDFISDRQVTLWMFVCVSLQVDVIKEAYLQGVESEVDGEVPGDVISPKDVGHNIYILAHQVGFYCQFRS